jgi:hypothetical protein
MIESDLLRIDRAWNGDHIKRIRNFGRPFENLLAAIIDRLNLDDYITIAPTIH